MQVHQWPRVQPPQLPHGQRAWHDTIKWPGLAWFNFADTPAGLGNPPPQVFLTTAYLVLVLEFAAGGDLARAVARCGCLPEEDARWLFQQIMCAVDYCHRMVSVAAAVGWGPAYTCDPSGGMEGHAAV